jgi:hypothetical protein
MAEDDSLRADILKLLSTELAKGQDILSIAANFMVVAINIYKNCLSEEEFIALMTMIYVSADTFSIPDDRVLH